MCGGREEGITEADGKRFISRQEMEVEVNMGVNREGEGCELQKARFTKIRARCGFIDVISPAKSFSGGRVDGVPYMCVCGLTCQVSLIATHSSQGIFYTAGHSTVAQHIVQHSTT